MTRLTATLTSSIALAAFLAAFPAGVALKPVGLSLTLSAAHAKDGRDGRDGRDGGRDRDSKDRDSSDNSGRGSDDSSDDGSHHSSDDDGSHHSSDDDGSHHSSDDDGSHHSSDDDGSHHSSNDDGRRGRNHSEDDGGFEVSLPGGGRIEIEGGRFERKDRFGNTVEERPATARDYAALEGRSALPDRPRDMAKVETSAAGIEVTWSDGWKEEIENGRYELKDPANRTVAERPATEADLDRLSGL